MRSLVVPLLLLTLLTVHIARADEKNNKNGGENTHDDGVGPVKKPHCKKPGHGPDPHADGHVKPNNDKECDEESPSPPDAAQPPSYVPPPQSPIPVDFSPPVVPSPNQQPPLLGNPPITPSPSSQYNPPATPPINQPPPPVASPLTTPPPQSLPPT
jgi:hypothetical protein